MSVLASLGPSSVVYASDDANASLPVAHLAVTETRGLCGEPISRTPDEHEEFAKCERCVQLWNNSHQS